MPRLLLAGAGHAHMAVMAAIPELVAKGHHVTAIGPGERHYYSGMGPGMLGLQSLSHPDIFGGGDCITFSPGPLDKVGVYAVRQNPVLLHNLQAQLEGRSLKVFDPGGAYLLIFNIGTGHGILHKSGIAFGGRAAFWVKDFIDRQFIRKFSPGKL